MPGDDRRTFFAAAAAREGQALPLAVGGIAAVLAVALALVAIAGALTGKARAQRAADLSAVSAARSMRDDLPRLLSPRTLPGGAPNPAHLSKRRYLERARLAARRSALANGVRVLRLSFPGPGLLRAAAGPRGRPGRGRGRRSQFPCRRHRQSRKRRRRPPPRPVPRRWPAAAATAARSSTARGRGCAPTSPPPSTAWRRPPRAPGSPSWSTPGFRSDAEQAALFAANPDPPVGRAAGSLAAPLRHRARPRPPLGLRLARRQRPALRLRPALLVGGLALRLRGRPGALLGGRQRGARTGRRRRPRPAGLACPRFVPARFRAPLLRAAARWNVSAALLAAQLMAESNFNPFAVSPAGAQGIAQFMPATAAAYGLARPVRPGRRDRRPGPPDVRPAAASSAQSALALAAYNAGPGAGRRLRLRPALSPRPRPTSPASSACSTAPARCCAPPLEVRLVAE